MSDGSVPIYEESVSTDLYVADVGTNSRVGLSMVQVDDLICSALIGPFGRGMRSTLTRDLPGHGPTRSMAEWVYACALAVDCSFDAGEGD